MNDLALLDAPTELKESVAECVRWSRDNKIVRAADFEATGAHLKSIKSAQRMADEFFDPPIKQAYELHKTLVSRKRIITDPLAESERTDKANMLAYQRAEEQKAEDERRRLQAIADEKARAERMKAEQEAEKQRQIEAEARRKADEARRAAEAASAAERSKLLAEAEAAERAAAKAAAKAETQDEAAISAVAPVISVATVQAPKVEGVSVRKTWKAEIVDLPALLTWICEGKRFEYITVNEKLIDAYAKAMREGANMPGVRFYESSTMASQGAR